MISKLCSVDKGAFIMLKRFLPSTLSHYNEYFELRRSFTMMSLSLPISSARNLWCFWVCYKIAHECSCYMKSWFAFFHERLWADVRLHFHYGPRWASDTFFVCAFFSKTLDFIKDRLLTASASQWRLFTFFMWQLLTESVIQQKMVKWNDSNSQRLPALDKTLSPVP